MLLFLPLHADEIFGRVVRVADGDTITILVSGDAHSVASETVGSRVPRDRSSERIRLHGGIDAPERGQPFGRASGRYLSSLVANRDVRVEYTNRDRYGRIVGIVFLDGRDVNLEMLNAGYAWHYKRYDSTTAYAQAEAEARAAKRGLWQGKSPIEPESFRKAKKAGSR